MSPPQLYIMKFFQYQGTSAQYGEDGNTILIKRKNQKRGLNVMSAAVFIIGEMAGSGVLALPRAIVNSGRFTYIF